MTGVMRTAGLRPGTGGFRLMACLATLLLAACAGSPREAAPGASAESASPAAAPAPAPLLLVSLDGVGADALFKGDTPHLDQIARRGLRSEGMRPAFPSLTFPNHYTVVTGLRPDRHGIIDNRMSDPELGRFALSDRKAVEEGRWWQDGEPIWATARRHGLRSATMFWPGSEASIRGVQPDHWLPYQKDLPKADRVARVLAWLDLPDGERPHLLTLYFEAVDTAGHTYGPGSAQERAALRAVDAAIGQLLDGLAARRLDDRVNLVIVSDHGMEAIDPARTVYIEDLPGIERAEVVHIGSQAGFNPLPGQDEALAQALVGRHGPMQCWRKQDLPARFGFGTHRRVPAIYCLADPGARIESRARRARPGAPPPNRGAHGYDPAHPAMAALFVADGPDLSDGAVLPAFDNVHVHPLLMALLGLAPLDGLDGDPAVLAPALSAGKR